jgi:zinc transporter 1/2/3
MASVFAIFLAEFFAFRIGTAYMERIGLDIDPHVAQGAAGGPHTSHEHRPHDRHVDIEQAPNHVASLELNDSDKKSALDFSSRPSTAASDPSAAVINPTSQIIGVIILEFGVIFHSIIIGLTLATSDDFTILFIVVSALLLSGFLEACFLLTVFLNRSVCFL